MHSNIHAPLLQLESILSISNGFKSTEISFARPTCAKTLFNKLQAFQDSLRFDDVEIIRIVPVILTRVARYWARLLFRRWGVYRVSVVGKMSAEDVFVGVR